MISHFYQTAVAEIANYVANMHLAEAFSVLFGILYLLLAMRQNILCWPAALISTGLAVYVFGDVNLVMESALNVYYFAMAIYGWWVWSNTGTDKLQVKSTVPIVIWCWQRHALIIALIGGLTAISGYYVPKFVSSDMPYLDAFTTWAAVIVTYMVTRKVLENWLYWLVINNVALYLFIQKDLYLYALLMLVYFFMAISGLIKWTRAYHAQKNSVSA